MEIKQPIVIIICTIISIIIFFISRRKKHIYINGKKISNTKYIKETEYYKKKVRKFIILSNLLKLLSVICIILTSILVARPITVKTEIDEKYNRDIFISLDMSLSQYEVNYELVKKFKNIISDIEGDRIGIVMYNTAPVVYCPLTEDYDYIRECLDEMEKQLKYLVEHNGETPGLLSDEGNESYVFWNGGIVADSTQRGSSLIGDGLAGTVYSFPEIKENKERTRIIIFATDNNVGGKEIISLDDACELCKKYDIKLYGYCPSVEMNKYTSDGEIAAYKNSVEETANGKFYTGNIDKMSSNIVNEIRNTKVSLIKTSKKQIITDHPEKYFISLIIIYSILIFIEKRILL